MFGPLLEMSVMMVLLKERDSLVGTRFVLALQRLSWE